MRRATGRVARRTLVWRAHRALVVRESENADHLDLLGSSLILARVAPSLDSSERQGLEPSVRDLSEVLAALARELGAARPGSAADRGADAPASSTLAVAITGVRMLATHVMVFAGIDPDDAVQAVRDGILEQRVTVPPRRRRFGRLRRRLTR
jgi:hypothetical protein